MNTAYTDNQLLQQLSGGDERAFTDIYNTHSGDIYEAAMAYLKEDALAKETVQEVFLKLWDKKATLGDVKKLKDYLFILARNVIYDHFRKVASERNKTAGLTITGDDPFALLENKDYQHLLNQAIHQLPPQQQKVFILAKQEGLSYEEIAGQLGISKWTVKNHMAQALDQLRATLKQNPLLLLFFLLH